MTHNELLQEFKMAPEEALRNLKETEPKREITK